MTGFRAEVTIESIGRRGDGVAAVTGPRGTGAKAFQPIEMNSHTDARASLPKHKETAG